MLEISDKIKLWIIENDKELVAIRECSTNDENSQYALALYKDVATDIDIND
jgi:hypothetical protein